jgi:hypothetical protein
MKKFLLLASLVLCFVKAYPQFTNCYSFVDYFEEIYTITTDGEQTYVGTDKTIHRSHNNGLNWEVMTGVGVNLPYMGKYKAILADGSDIYAGSDEGIYLSVNGGATFELKNNGMSLLQVLDIFKIGNAIYAGVHCWSGITHYDQRILRSTDKCETWTNISGDLPFRVFTVYSIAWDGTWLYAGTDDGVYRSQNQGQNWIAINQGLSYKKVNKLLVVNNTVVFAGTDKGLYRWTNSDGAWTKLTNGLPEDQRVAGLVEVDSKLVASFDRSSIFVSPDMGKNWYNIGLGLHDAGIRSDIATNDQYLFALTLPNRHLMVPGKVHRRQLGDALHVPMIDTTDTQFSIFENPVQNYITITNLTGEDAIVYFYSTNGRLLLQRSLNQGVNTIEIRYLPSGILLTRCVGRNSVISDKIFKL